MNGSLNYYVISQLEMFGKRLGKRDEILHVEAFTLLHPEKKASEDYHHTVWRSERKPNRLSRQKSLNKIQRIKQKPTEEPSEFLERLHQAYTRYTDRDPETRENVRMINKTFIRQSTPQITKLWKLDYLK